MSAILVTDRTEFDRVWQYSTPPEEKDYPKSYPSVVELIDRQGEMHFLSWTEYNITAVPDGLDPETFLAGYIASSEVDRSYR